MSDEMKQPEMLSMLEEIKDDSVEKLTEQLGLIKEVRNELVKAYSDMNNLKATNEKLSVDISNYNNEIKNATKTIESLSKELNAYKARDAEVEKLNYNKKLEQLSANFKILGQERTVEELSKLDKSIVSEFETITKMAIDKKSSERLDAITVPSQAMSTPKKVVPQKQNNGDFFKGMCNVLSNQQEVQSKQKLIYL